MSQNKITLEKVHQLRGEIRQVETGNRNDDGTVVSSGCAAMDRLLPVGGYHRGTIVEWLAEPGSGVDYLSLLGARNATGAGGALVIADGKGEFYPPAARAAGIKLSNLIILRSNERGPSQGLAPCQNQPLENDDLCWAIDQSLRCNAVAAVWGTLPEFGSLHEERTWLRRFQLSAESSGCIGFFVRSMQRTTSSWAEVQWQIQPQPSSAAGRRIQASLSRCPGGLAGQTVELEINVSTGNVLEYEGNPGNSKTGKDRSTHSMPLASKLAHPTPRRRSARA